MVEPEEALDEWFSRTSQFNILMDITIEIHVDIPNIQRYKRNPKDHSQNPGKSFQLKDMGPDGYHYLLAQLIYNCHHYASISLGLIIFRANSFSNTMTIA
ncbi:hypothetical protein FGO68_gene14859 [Halteria grandinella]|uniref:Uncharacterized protein n=1 Tax=Halteria grandinella TaxID=5974 RepID=A0A8J8T618_HALGN|nr:hypothetical protein FGO68_gene14859 [Halteria grandinella]